MLALKVIPDGWVEAHRPVVEGFMVDTLRIERRTGVTEGPNDEEISVYGIIYEGKGVVELPTRLPQQFDSAESPLVTNSFVGRIPNATVDVQEHDRVTILTSPDPGMVGAQFTVVFTERQDFAVDRQFNCVRVIPQDATWPTSD